MKIVIRPYTKKDYQYTHDLHCKNMKSFVDKYWGGWDSDIYKKDVCPEITWIVEYAGLKAGFFVLSFKEKAHLRNLQISYSFQNKGIGSHVLDHCERESVRKGFTSLYLEVFIENQAKSLYDRLGYKTYKITDSHYMMMKQIQLRNQPKQIIDT